MRKGAPLPPASRKLPRRGSQEGEGNAAIQRDRDELRGLLGPGGEGGRRGAGGHGLRSQPVDEFHGRGGHGGRKEHRRRRRGRGLRRKPEGRGKSRAPAGGRPRGPGDAEAAAQAPALAGLPAGADVYLDGARHVGLAPAALFQRQPCGDGACAAPARRGGHGHQPEIFHQRLPRAPALRAEHGHARGARLFGGLRLQRVGAVCHDGRAGRRRKRGRDALDA